METTVAGLVTPFPLLQDRIARPLAPVAATAAGVPADATPQVTLEPLEPPARVSLHHCYEDHHNVRDTLLVINFSECGVLKGKEGGEVTSTFRAAQTTGA